MLLLNSDHSYEFVKKKLVRNTPMMTRKMTMRTVQSRTEHMVILSTELYVWQ